jgi:hypothetical protein
MRRYQKPTPKVDDVVTCHNGAGNPIRAKVTKVEPGMYDFRGEFTDGFMPRDRPRMEAAGYSSDAGSR